MTHTQTNLHLFHHSFSLVCCVLQTVGNQKVILMIQLQRKLQTDLGSCKLCPTDPPSSLFSTHPHTLALLGYNLIHSCGLSFQFLIHTGLQTSGFPTITHGNVHHSIISRAILASLPSLDTQEHPETTDSALTLPRGGWMKVRALFFYGFLTQTVEITRSTP